MTDTLSFPVSPSLTRSRRLLFVWFLVLFLMLGTGFAGAAERHVRVGIFENMPAAGYQEQGRAQGMYVEILESIAESEGWMLHYVPGTMVESIARLTRGDIDMLITLARSEKRAQQLEFTAESPLSTWGEVYLPPESDIQSILDLDGKTVAVMRSSLFLNGAEGLQRMAERFEIDIEYLESADNQAAMQAVAEGAADAALVNRLVALEQASQMGLKRSAILIKPIAIRFAFRRGHNADLRLTIDLYIRELKTQHTARYNDILGRWLGNEGRLGMPAWLVPGAYGAGTFILMLIGFNLYTRHQIRRATQQIRSQKELLEREVAERQLTELKLREQEQRLKHLAHHDSLTGLPNRILFLDRLTHAMALVQRDHSQLAVLFIDLDQFKKINDSLGHAAGDQVLCEASRRIRARMRVSDTLARLGGDEFVVLLEQLQSDADAAVVAGNIAEVLYQPMSIAGSELFITGSVGISIYPRDGDSTESLMQAADVAMYRAKEQGRNNYQFYQKGMNARTRELLQRQSDLRKAVENDQLLLHYQPQFDLDSGDMVGIESLVRWQLPGTGLVPPAEFITLAEESDLIVDIGNWVLREACSQNRAWQDAGLPPTRVAVNVSARHFWRHDFIETLDQALQESGLDPRWLELEITESMVMNDVDQAVRTMSAVRARGIHLAVDDFGTGYSSLNALKMFPINKLKIDFSFVRDLLTDPDDAAIVESIIALAGNMGLESIAEGVEHAEQVDMLRNLGCGQAQGFLFARPMSAARVEPMLGQCWSRWSDLRRA